MKHKFMRAASVRHHGYGVLITWPPARVAQGDTKTRADLERPIGVEESRE